MLLTPLEVVLHNLENAASTFQISDFITILKAEGLNLDPLRQE